MSRDEIQQEYQQICLEVGHTTFEVLDIHNQQKVLADRVKELDAKIAGHRKRKIELERALADLPVKESAVVRAERLSRECLKEAAPEKVSMEDLDLAGHLGG